MSDLYNHINELCKTRGTNITALCREAGVGRATLSELNAGRTKTITAETASRLARVLGVSVDYLLGTETEKPAPERDGLTDEDIMQALLDDEIDEEIAASIFRDVQKFARFAYEDEKRRSGQGKDPPPE